MTKSGVSRAIARLETRTGRRLFDRHSRALKLTDEGRLFYEQVAPLVARLGVIADGPPGDGPTVRGRLRVSADAAFGHYLLTPRLGALLDRHPALQLDVVVRDRIGDLIADGFDIAVRFGEPKIGDVERSLLLTSRVVTCASPAYIARVGPPTEPDALLDPRYETIRLLDDVTGRPHVWHFAKGDDARVLDPEGRLVLNDAGGMLAAARAGVGIVRALDFMVRDLIEHGELVELLPTWNSSTWPAYIYYPTRARAHPSPTRRAFIDFVCEQMHVDPQPIVAPPSPQQ